MTDVHDKETRSYNMSRIRGKNTKPELIVRKFLFSKGLRYKLHDQSLPGKPDIVLPKYKKIIFINGCFWHGHEGCRYFVIPTTRTEWWMAKITRNKEIDLKTIEVLQKMGWSIRTIWECELNAPGREKKLNEIFEFIKIENSGN
jgi:DNA mismatch endonuclease (patch repair protein)